MIRVRPDSNAEYLDSAKDIQCPLVALVLMLGDALMDLVSFCVTHHDRRQHSATADTTTDAGSALPAELKDALEDLVLEVGQHNRAAGRHKQLGSLATARGLSDGPLFVPAASPASPSKQQQRRSSALRLKDAELPADDNSGAQKIQMNIHDLFCEAV